MVADELDSTHKKPPDPPNVRTWANELGNKKLARNEENVMEIVLEKEEKGSFDIGEKDVAKALKKLGADLTP